MKRFECLEALASLVEDELVVAALGGTTDEWRHIADSDAAYYNISMGSNVPLGLGLALALPDRGVIVLDTDGCQFMVLSPLCTVANEDPANLRIFVSTTAPTATRAGSQPQALAAPTSARSHGALASSGSESSTTSRDSPKLLVRRLPTTDPGTSIAR